MGTVDYSDSRYFDPIDEADTPVVDGEVAPTPVLERPPLRTTGARRKRVRMGALLDQMGNGARARIDHDSSKYVVDRERKQKASLMLNAGRNKGEERGFGATSSPEYRR